MPGYHHGLLEKDPAEHIAWLTPDRPQRRSALDDLITTELRDTTADVYEGR